VRGFGDAFDSRWDGTCVTAEDNDLERLTERGQCRDQLGCIAADSRGGRTEGVTVEPDSKRVSVLQEMLM
jgi:hypothetical protein